jgi:2-keto-4-pentenoate hydratase
MQSSLPHAICTTRAGNFQLDALPAAARPQTRGDGYAVQERLLDLLDAEPAGWLLGLTNATMQMTSEVDQPYFSALQMRWPQTRATPSCLDRSGETSSDGTRKRGLSTPLETR